MIALNGALQSGIRRRRLDRLSSRARNSMGVEPANEEGVGMIEIGTASSGLLAASIASTKLDAVARSAVARRSFVDNSLFTISHADASVCLGGLRGAPPPLSG
jgi:hypothetical protein